MNSVECESRRSKVHFLGAGTNLRKTKTGREIPRCGKRDVSRTGGPYQAEGRENLELFPAAFLTELRTISPVAPAPASQPESPASWRRWRWADPPGSKPSFAEARTSFAPARPKASCSSCPCSLPLQLPFVRVPPARLPRANGATCHGHDHALEPRPVRQPLPSSNSSPKCRSPRPGT